MLNHRLTPSGLIFLGITAFVFVAAINSGTNLLFLALGLMVGGFVVAAVLSRLSLSKLDVRRIMTDHVVAGEPADLQYQIINRKRRWPCFAIRIREGIPNAPSLAHIAQAYALHIPPTRSVTVPTRFLAMHRGLIRLRDIRLTCSFPFGFVSHDIQISQPEELVVYPRIGALNRHLALRCRDATESGTMTSTVRRGNDEFYGLREYRAGDNVRSIHWRSTARTGRLTIREMANNAPPQMIIVLNLRNWRTTPNAPVQIERAIELAASLLCYAFLENFAVALAIPGQPTEAPPIPHMGREARSTLLYRLATLDPETLEEDLPLPLPNRLGTRAEWILITLNNTDTFADIVPPSAAKTVLSLDAPESEEWVHFVSADETLRILRESPAPPAAPSPPDKSIVANPSHR